jgi:hypothetical protein
MTAARQTDDAEISGGVKLEREYVEGDENAGQGFLGVSKIVFEIVSVGLQHASTVRVRWRPVQ